MTMPIMPTCSCGETAPHVIARRRTSDDIAVEIWHDGAITGRLGRALPGVPIARPRTTKAVDRAHRVAQILTDEVSLYDLAEVPRLYECARRVVANGGGRRELLAAYAPIGLNWEIYQTDRDGKPTVRVARLDEIRLAVWHECSVYTLFEIRRTGFPGCAHMEDVLFPTGLKFTTQTALRDYLSTVQRSTVAP